MMSWTRFIMSCVIGTTLTSSLLGDLVVADQADLVNAINNINSQSEEGPIVFNSPSRSIQYDTPLPPLNANETFTHIEQPFTINGNGQTLENINTPRRAFFARGDGTLDTPPEITINNLTIKNAHGKGGDGGQFGGGGALGAGGGLFVNTGSTVILDGVAFENCGATGGNGQDGFRYNTLDGGSGGGGGFGGNGGSSENLSAAAGGGGFNSSGGNTETFNGGGGGGFNGNGEDAQPSNGGKGGGINGTAGGSGSGIAGDGGGGSGGGSPSKQGGSGGVGGGGGGGGYGSPTSAGDGGDFGGGGGGNIASAGPTASGGNGGFGGAGGGGGFGINTSGPGVDGADGGDGGFGSGGGGGGTSRLGIVGNGGMAGFGGGNGADGADGNTNLGGSGGGGAAMGGAIFIQNGAAVRIQSSISFTGSELTAGTGGSGGNDGSTLGTDIFLMSGGTLTVRNLTTDSSVPNPIKGDSGMGGGSTSEGGVFMDSENTATFTLNGANTYTGKTTIDSGTLHVNGSVITPVEVNGGTFGGANTIIKVDPSVTNSGNLTVNGGMVSPGGNHLYGNLTVENNLEFTGGGLLDAEVDSLSNTDSITVQGSATLTGTLAVEVAKGNFLEGQAIRIIEATGGISGTFSSENLPLQPNGDPLFRVQYNPNSVDLIALADAVFDPSLTGQTVAEGNPQIVKDYMISQSPIDPNSDFGFIVRSLGVVSNDQINDVLNLMHPAAMELLAAMNLNTNAEIMAIFSRHSLAASRSASEPISQLEPSLTAAADNRPFYPSAPMRRGCARNANDRHNVWITPFGTWNHQKKQRQLRGTHYQSAGFVAGYDYLFDHFSLGAGMGYAYTDFKWYGNAGNGHINQVYGGLSGSYFMKYFSATLATMVGGNFYHTNRRIKYSAAGHPDAFVDRTARSNSYGTQWTNHLGLIGDFSPFSIPVQIFANLDHFYLHNNSFNESGADSLNLKVNTKVSNALRSELGLSSSYTFNTCGGCWTPYARISWVNKTPLSSSSIRSGFIGQTGTFSVNGTSHGTNQWAPGLGAQFTNSHGLSLLLNTRAELNGRMKNYSADLQMDYTF